MSKDLNNIYNYLKANTADMPEYDIFAQDMQDESFRHNIYKAISERVELPAEDEWYAEYGYGKRRDVKKANKAEAEDNLNAMRESGLVEQAKEMKKEYGQQKRQARRDMLMQGLATMPTQGMPQAVKQQNAEAIYNNENYEQTAQEYAQAKLAHGSLRDAIREERSVGRWFLDDMWAKTAETVTDLSNWDFGISDMVDAATLSTLAEKAESGTLTASEDRILDAVALAQAIQGNASKLDTGARDVIGGALESFGFMAQMAANPASGAAKALGKRAIRKYGADAIEMTTRELVVNHGGKALAKKVGAELAGGAGEAAAFAVSTGAMRTAADAINRQTGTIQSYIDNNGFIQNGGFTEGDDATEAILKAFGNTFIEGYTEQLGGALIDPLFGLMRGTTKGAVKTSLGELKQGLLEIKGKEWSNAITKLKSDLKWYGFVSEALEEEIGMISQGLFGIEDNLSRYNEDGTINENWMFGARNQVTMLLSTALMTGSFEAAEKVGNIHFAKQLNRYLSTAESDGAKAWGESWGAIKEVVDQLGVDEIARYINDMASDPAVTNERLAAMANYAITLVRYQQYNIATEREQDELSEIQRNAMTAYNAGRQMHIANFRSVQQRADKAYDALAKRDADLLKRADGWLEQQKQTGKLPVAEIETIRNGLSADMSTLLDEYIGAMTARQGIYDNIDDTAYSAMDVFERDLAPVIRNGVITTATLDGKPVYVLSQENGSAVILSEDAETEHEGKGMMVDASRLKDISTIDAKQLVDAYRYRYATDEQTKADMALNHHPNTQMPTVGMQIDTPSVVEGGATTFIVTNVQPQMGYVELVPGEYDAEQGKVVPKDGAEPIYQTVYSTLQMQDDMYDALDALNGIQSVPVESEIIEDNNEQTEEEAPVVVPTEEEVVTQEEEVAPTEEEVAPQETTPAERTQAEIDADDAAELAELGDNDYISSNLEKAKKVLDKAKKKKPKATEKEARLTEARAIKAEVDAAQAEVDRWTAASQEVARRALQATQTEQAPISETAGVGENIQSNWAEAEKIEGNTGSKTLQDGTVIKGRYMLVPASAPTASHDALNGYAPSVGFPTNERGQNINDRDYHNDKAAQAETDRIARVYGGQAVSDTPVVSPEGIVYSGNGRTMASQLAAANGTDTAYMDALRSNAAQFGFTPEQVDSMPNARVVFVTNEVLPYTTETFAKFNQQEKKTQSSTERAVSKSKSLKDTSIARILSIIDSYDTLQSFFSSPKACADMLSVLQQDGVITEAEVAGLTKLNSNNETILSATGRDLVTDVVLGATFSEQTLRQMGGDKALKQSVLRALPSIIENRQLKEYALNNELEKAISLLYEARKAKMSLEQFLQTTDMFNGSPTDRYSVFEVLLAEKFNNSTEAFRVMMQLYNNSASVLVGGQSELFGEALTKEDLQNLILEKYGKQTNNRGDQAEPVVQSVSGNRQDNETTAAERRAKYGITAKEDARREPLRERAREVAEELGANINVIEDKSEVTNEDAKKQMRQHKNSIVKGWFENSTGELFIVLPSMDDMADLEATILHELVAHKGLRNLLGARKFNQLCDAVWEMMTPEQQQEWLAYPGVNGNKRAAADEYIASLAEKMDLSEVEQTTWNKIKQFVLDVLQKLGFRDITENDIQDLIRASYAYMRAGNTNEQTTNEGNRYKVYRSRDGKEVGYTQLSQLSLQFDWGERERDTVSGRHTDVLQREDNATLATLNTNRQLEEGEVCNVERIFTESKGFDFTSGEKIESAADVAYIFKNLEDEAIENVFVALVKDGKPTVIHVGMGGQAYTLVDNSAVVAAANRINPEKVYLVHNHPSGALRCSPQDRSMLKSIKDALGDVVQDGIIINTRSGKFGVFSESMFGTDGTSDMPENKEDSPLKVYKFNKQAFKNNVITVEASPYSIAEFISTQRLGSRNKINALLLNNLYGCVGNVFLTETEVNDANRDSIAQRLVDDAVAMNAKNIVIYGNSPLVSVAVESNIQLREAIEKASGKTVELKDVIEINGSTFPPSALNYGVRFRTTIAPEVRKEMEAIKADAIANGTFLKAPSGKDTNLNEEQWLMVRTNNFKKWFGDWMLAATETPVFRSKGTFANLATAEKWAKENLQGQSRVNKYTGEEISISRKSVSEMLNEKTLKKSDSVNNHLAALQSVLDFIETGIPAEVHADTHGRDFDVMRLYNAIEIDGKVYRVKSTVRKVKQGDKFYTYEVQEMELIEERGANPNREGVTPHNGNTSNNSITGAKLLNGVKKTNSNEEILQYSKVVDENGEPMVVYHGTDSEFTSFEMQDGSMGHGAYFTSNWDEAAQYAMEKQGVENIDELDESKIKEVFLNVRDENNITHSRFSRGDIEILATSPNQIKSATDNNGEFGENNDIRFRTVFHGSGATFNQFDHSHMGEGEGAQAFGWGTYVTEVEGIGKQYAKATSKPRLAYKGEMVDSEDFYNPWRIIKDLYNDNHGRLRNMRAAAERYSGMVEEDNVKLKELWANVLEKLNEVRAGDLKIVPGRNLYTVEIPDDNGSNYLHWDERVPMNVVNSIKKRLFDVLAEGDYKGAEKELKRELDDVFKAENNDGYLLYGNISAYLGGGKAASQFLNDMGFVGISYPAQAMTGGRKDKARNYVIFNENDAQIKERTRFRVANRNQEIFVSNAQRAVESIKQDKATPEQWLAMLTKQGGIKVGEDKWLGLSDWLKASDAKTITKQDILDFIDENKIKIEEVKYGDANNVDGFASLKEEYDQWLREEGSDYAWGQLIERYGDDAEIAFNDLGGELVVENEERAAALLGGGNIINSTRLDYTTAGLDNNREIALVVPTIESWNKSDEVHFGDAGEGRAVAWVRFGETTADTDETIAGKRATNDYLAEMREKYNTLEGKETDAMSAEEIKHLQELTAKEIKSGEKKARVLVIDEIQSKRHQEGREKGYATEEYIYAKRELDYLYMKMYEKGLTEEEYERYKWLQQYTADNFGIVPDAPFDKNWHELAMKRMLRLAAEEGYDYVAWTTGAQQADRYNIGGVVKRITSESYGLDDNGDVTRLISIALKGEKDDIRLEVDKNGLVIDGDADYEGKHLNEIVGKDMAVRLMARDIEMSGDNLRIGGEGMKGFYDKMLPSFVSKYTKKWGAKVQDIELPNLRENNVMHSVDITPEMKESVMEGQTMFRIKEVNDKFNEELQQQIDGTLPKGHIYQLGMPSGILQACGFPDMPIELSSTNLAEHSRKTHHPFELNDVKGLVYALQDPVAAFSYGDKKKSQNVIVEIQRDDRNFLIGVHFNQNRGGLEVSSIRGVFPKDSAEWLNWINQNKALYLNKEKIQDLILKQRKTLADVKYLDLDSVAKVIEDFENPTIATEENTDETGTSFRVVTDKATLDRLNSEPTIKVYRAMQLIDGKLYPPMSAVVDGKLREPSEIGVWEEAEENPELADEKGYFKLNKGNKKSVPARYNPYFHTSRTPLNDQFASAQDRPELVTVEVEVPESELTSGYKAEKAKDSVGAMQWKAGVVQSKLSGKREVILSRWAKPIRIVPDSEVADEIVKMFNGRDITMPSNVVTPSLRAELEKRGVPFVETDNQGKEIEDRTMFSVKQRTEADYQDIENRLGIAAAEYERRMDMTSVHHMEAWQDSMRSLLEMQRAIEKETGKPILDYENAYMAENRMSSENLAQMEEWKRKFFRPLEDIYKGFIDRGENQFSIRDYLFAKHGMERNTVMARREAQRLYPNDPLQQIAKESDLKRTKDYSGLKKLMGKDNIPDAIAEAQKYVHDFEKKHKAEIAKLWDAIRNATHSQLEVQRASGLLSQEKYEEIKNMYNYYVPLRGFSETTADEVYDYLDNAPTPYNVPIKTAKGRESVGDDPIANIANMADSGIMQANRNKMKLHFLNMAEQHKTNLVTVSEVIYKYNPVAKMWEPTLPQLSPNDTIEETLAKIRQHRANVAKEMILNPQDYKTEANLKKMGRDIPYKVINKAMLSEHQVLVMREGKQIVMTINGNPRAAQALNGLTNPEVKAEGQHWIQKANRFMAANFTSRNPAFVISNLSRDSIYAVSMVWAKEAPKYARAFMNNMGKVFANMASLMHKYNNGTLDTNIPMEKMFLEFVMNGGQTGYTHLNSVEDYKRQMAKEMKRAAQHKGVRAVTETGRAILNGLESMNKWAENISRFTAYVTSREDGRSISRSISDAKEISVNFNKKGAGNSVAGKFEKGNRLNYLSSQASQLARGLYIFMNAGIQGMANFGKQAKRHPGKVTAMIASSMALGLAAALLSGGGDDEEEYLSLPKYIRRNNLCIKVGDKFVTIPLPIELRAFYGIGELIASRTALGEYYSDIEFAKEFAEQLSQLLPIDVLEGGEGFNIKSFIPSAAKPIVDAILNESWTGIPIYNDSEFVKTYPGWKKAYKGTNDILVDVSRWLNEVSGGSDYKQGVIDINPAAIEYIAEQYFGGVGSTINQFFKMGQTATGAMEFEWRNVPVASRFVNSGNETTQIRAIRSSYYDYREEMDAVGKEFNAYMRDLKEPDLSEKEYQRIEQEIDRIVNSPEYDFYLWWKDISKVINRAKDAGDTQGADELMREAVETYRSWKKGLK